MLSPHFYTRQTAVYFSSVCETMVRAAGTFAQCEKKGDAAAPVAGGKWGGINIKIYICTEKNFKAAQSYFSNTPVSAFQAPPAFIFNAQHYEHELHCQRWKICHTISELCVCFIECCLYAAVVRLLSIDYEDWNPTHKHNYFFVYARATFLVITRSFGFSNYCHYLSGACVFVEWYCASFDGKPFMVKSEVILDTRQCCEFAQPMQSSSSATFYETVLTTKV